MRFRCANRISIFLRSRRDVSKGVTGTFRLTVRKDMELRWPFAESATHLMSIGLDEDLDERPSKSSEK
jgi:hypothetical protein